MYDFFLCTPIYICLGRRIAMLIFAAKLVFWGRKVGRQNKPDGGGEERDQDIRTLRILFCVSSVLYLCV
jgi:hypothetical protein